MLARYQIVRGQPRAEYPPADAIRQDTRKHTRHCLRPSEELVTSYLNDPSAASWRAFRQGYVALLEERFTHDRGPFDELAALAGSHDVFLGCSCPTKANPDVHHCHTVLALGFMKGRYADLSILLPPPAA
jgi:uncharacterized protein YeaO (DUF488 family)